MTPSIVEIAEKYQTLKVIIAHYYWPNLDYCYEVTKGFKNIYFDTSALADDEVETETGKTKIKNILEKTIYDNPKKVLYGTDYGMCDIKKHIMLIESLDINDSIKEMIFYKNSQDIFNLKI